MFCFHIIGAGRGGTSLMAALLDAHPNGTVHLEACSKFLMGQEWTAAESEANPERRVSMRIENFLAACEAKSVRSPALKWGHKTTTEQIMGLANIHPDSDFGKDALARPSTTGFDVLNFFVERTCHIKTIFILRDGRSCIPSKVRRTGQPVEGAIRLWKYSVRVLAALQAGHPRLHVLKMENLLKWPEEQLRGICEFLEIPFMAEMLRGTRSDKMPVKYRRDGFDASVTNISEFNEPWLADIRDELGQCGYETGAAASELSANKSPQSGGANTGSLFNWATDCNSRLKPWSIATNNAKSA